jgi:glycosyltransferase involved in cell wall biosynthesis
MSEQLSEKTKILFIIPDLYSGGAQRVFTNLINGFSRERFEITLVTLIKPKDEHYRRLIPADVRFIQYNFQNTKAAFFALVSLIRKENPQVVFSTLTHLNFILSIVKFFVSGKVSFVARESSIISSSLKDEKQTFLFHFLYSRIYRNFDLIICQSKAMAADLVKNYKIKESSIKIIHNPVDFDYIFECIALEKKTRSNSQRVELLCVGRLDPQKGYDRLL